MLRPPIGALRKPKTCFLGGNFCWCTHSIIHNKRSKATATKGWCCSCHYPLYTCHFPCSRVSLLIFIPYKKSNMSRRNKKPAAVAASNSKSSVVEKLQMLRSFVGDQHSENDLSSCLSQAGYAVELAAERLMTGQYQPSKKVKTHNFLAPKAPTSKPAASSPPSSSAAPVSIAPKPTPKAVQKSPSLSTDSAQKPKIRRPVPLVTPKTPKSSSSSSPNHNQALEQQQLLLPSSWLLCKRWVSNGTCTQRNGSIDHKERLLLEHTETGPPMVRFRGNRIQGQFPKHLSHMLAPLLRHSTPIVLIQAEALMEDRNLPVGADVAFSVRYVE